MAWMATIVLLLTQTGGALPVTKWRSQSKASQVTFLVGTMKSLSLPSFLTWIV